MILQIYMSVSILLAKFDEAAAISEPRSKVEISSEEMISQIDPSRLTTNICKFEHM